MDAGNDTLPTGEPTVTEVDNIDMAVDPNDAIIDDNGRIIQALDREKNVMYKVKGTDSPLPESAPANSDDSAGEDENGNSDNPQDADSEDEPTYSNPAEYVLRRTGYEQDEVDLGDGIGKVKIADLTPEQQADLIAQEFENTVESYEARIRELEGATPDFKFDSPQAQQIFDYLKEGGDIQKLAKEIISRDPAAQAKIMTDAEIVKAGIRKDFPEWTDEEIDEEFKSMDESKVARRAKAYRGRMEKEQPRFDDLTEEQRNANAAVILREQQEFERQAGTIREAAKKLEKIAGITVNDQLRDYLVKQVVPDKFDDDSAFVKDLVDNPQTLLELQFWKTYGNDILSKAAEHYFELGLREANKGKEKLSDTPLRTYSGKTSSKAASAHVKQPKSVGDIDFDALLRNVEF